MCSSDLTSFSNLPSLLRALISASAAVRFEFQRPDEHRLLLQLETLVADLDVASECVDSEHFLLPFEDIAGEFERGKARRMEHFYRKMRRRHHVLIDAEGGPEGGTDGYGEKGEETGLVLFVVAAHVADRIQRRDRPEKPRYECEHHPKRLNFK